MDMIGYFLLGLMVWATFYGLIHMALTLEDISTSMKNIRNILQSNSEIQNQKDSP